MTSYLSKMANVLYSACIWRSSCGMTSLDFRQDPWRQKTIRLRYRVDRVTMLVAVSIEYGRVQQRHIHTTITLPVNARNKQQQLCNFSTG